MKVSVVVTCYNYAAYVAEAVDSVLDQRAPAAEVIVVDDGSTDDSPRVLASRYGSDARVSVLRTSNAGQLAAFQTGVANAHGDVVAFLDADDRWHRDYLTAVGQKFLAAPDADIVITQVRTFGNVAGRSWRTETRDRRIGYEVMRTAFRWHRNFVPTSGIAMRTPLARRVVDVPAEMRTDWVTRADDVLIFGAALLGACKHVIAEPLVEYRVHDANLWYERKASYLEHCRYAYRQHRLLQHFSRVGAVSADLLRHAHLEFKSIERPIWQELRAYLAVSCRAPVSWSATFHQWLLMSVYFWRARREARGRSYH